jgi:hypothetical protein
MPFTEFFRALTGGGGKARLMATDIAADQYFALPAVGGTSGSPAMIATGTSQAYDFLSTLANAEIAIGTTANLTISTMHVCSGTSSDYTVTLPAVGANTGKFVGVRMAPGLTKFVTIKGNAAELIDGLNTRVMWANESAVLYCDGVTWTKMAGKTIPMRCTVYANASQTFSAGAMTKITFGTLDTDNTNRMATSSNSQIIIFRPGEYIVGAALDWSLNNGSACSVQIFIKNTTGPVVMGAGNKYYTSSQNNNQTINAVLTLAAGAVMEIDGNYSAGNFSSACFNFYAAYVPAYTFFTITEIPTW